MQWEQRDSACNHAVGAADSAMQPKQTSSKKRALVRGEPVVRGILEATMTELSAAGYGALRIEDVATRAGVNKTTIYRRWPTKQDLVRAALQSISVDSIVPPDTGSLRTDLLQIGRDIAEHASAPEHKSLELILRAEEGDPELTALAQFLHESLEAIPRPVIEAARARGELAENIDAHMLFRAMVAVVHHQVLMERKRVDDEFLQQLVDLVLLGALSADKRGPPAKGSPPPRTSRKRGG
jgi:AcrR family transcriptional regulator